MLGLSLESQFGQQISARLPGMAQAAFGPEICPVDGKYFTQPLEMRANSSVRPDIKELHITLERSADIVHSFVIKVKMPLLPEGTKWKKNVADILFGHFERVSGAASETNISLLKNNTMCRSRNKWPTFNNNPDNLRDPATERWIVSIPIMLETVIPLIKLFWHATSFVLHDFFKEWDDLVIGPKGFKGDEFDLWLECEGVFLDRPSRAALANEGTKVVIPTQTVHQFKFLESQESIINKHIPKGNKCAKIRLDINDCATYIVISYTPDERMFANSHPIKKIEVQGNANTMAIYDYVDLEELNWLRCGVLSPISETRGISMCDTFLYLIPFCRDALKENPTCWLDARRLDNFTLCLESKENIPEGSMSFMVQGINIRNYSMGMTGLMSER